MFRYRDANTYTDCLTKAEAENFQRLQNGGTIVEIKTMDDWHQDGRDLGKYLQIGDAVAEDVADYFLGVLPPATQLSNLIQIGEPNDHIRGRATFATIYKTGGIWRWMGFCYRGEVTEP